MSGHTRAPVRAPSPSRPNHLPIRRAAPLLASAVSLVLVGGLAAAEPLPGRRSLEPEEARGAGLAIRLERRLIAGASLIVVTPWDGPVPARFGDRVLAVSAAGRAAALADRIGPAAEWLIVASDDGGQVQFQLPGVSSAGFAPAGDWLAAIDGRGALWRIEVAAGSPQLVAEGPFIGPPLVLADGSVAALSVPSLEAPWTSRAVLIDPASGATVPLSDEPLVYAVLPIGDRIALVAHRPDGLRVRQAGLHGRVLAELGSGVTAASVSADGEVVAFAHGESGVFVLNHAPVRWLGAGSRPRLAPDGASLLLEASGETLLLALDGSRLAGFGSGAVLFADCGPECAP